MTDLALAPRAHRPKRPYGLPHTPRPWPPAAKTAVATALALASWAALAAAAYIAYLVGAG